VSRRSEIVAVILTHTFDYDAGECMCGYAAPSTLALAVHVAEQIEAVLA
jgi:hypothetical protein